MSATDRNLQPVSVPTGWSPDSWRAHSATQQPQYPDAEALAAVQRELGVLPPLVTSWEILALKKQIAEAQEGKRFLLQGGDCAESFSDCESGLISNRLEGAAADEPRARARPALAGGARGAVRRPVRQAALDRQRNAR